MVGPVGGPLALAYFRRNTILRVVHGAVTIEGEPALVELEAILRDATDDARLRVFENLPTARGELGGHTLGAYLNHDLVPSPLSIEVRRPVNRSRKSLSGDELTLGRDPSCDIVVDDPSVSRVHAALEWTVDHYVVRDRDSRRGTRVRGCGSAPLSVMEGDTILLGDVEVALLPIEIEAEETLEVRADRRKTMATVEPYIIVNGRCVHLDRPVFELGESGHLPLGSDPELSASLIRAGDGVELSARAGAAVSVNRTPLDRRLHLRSGDRIDFGRIPCVFVWMQPPREDRSAIDALLAEFLGKR